jgi:hypothetical protein
MKILTDRELGQAIRELWSLSGQPVLILPQRGAELQIAVLDEMPDEDHITLLEQCEVSSGVNPQPNSNRSGRTQSG